MDKCITIYLKKQSIDEKFFIKLFFTFCYVRYVFLFTENNCFLIKKQKGQDKTCPYISTVTDAKLRTTRICSISAT